MYMVQNEKTTQNYSSIAGGTLEKTTSLTMFLILQFILKVQNYENIKSSLYQRFMGACIAHLVSIKVFGFICGPFRFPQLDIEM